jgi:hypothetical protein
VSVCGLWSVVCGLWCVVCGLWSVVCGLWSVVCGLSSVSIDTHVQYIGGFVLLTYEIKMYFCA